MKNKIFEITDLKERIRKYQKGNKTVVICYGIFDVLHIGHIRYLKQAEQFGDVIMIVLISDAELVTKEKTKYNEFLRAEALAHLDWIDAVSINRFDSWETMLRTLRPDVYARGFESVQYDAQESHAAQQKFFEDLGTKHITVKEDTFSSTTEINRYLSGCSKEVQEYIHLFKKRFSAHEVVAPLDRLQGLDVLVIGDTIIDEYQYCSVIGKSSKDPTLALKFESRDLFAGGVLAVANHIAGFVNRVELVTLLGDHENHEGFIRERLEPNVFPTFIYRRNAPTIIKRRFVDGYSMNKLFEVYIMDDSALNEEQDAELHGIIQRQLQKHELVIITDYGHGALTMRNIEFLARASSYLAVNTQSNAGNRGFNTISRYPKADFVILAEHEIRLETRDLNGRLFPMMKKLSEQLSCRQLIVTRGKKGCMLFDRQGGLIQIPSFAQNIVDRVGAGDAFFSISAIAAHLEIPEEILGFLGNVAGSLAVEIMGNQKPLQKAGMKDFIRQLLS